MQILLLFYWFIELFYSELSLFTVISFIINTEDHPCMLIQPNNNKINRPLLHSAQQRHIQMTNGYGNVVSSRMVAAHSPQHKVITQPQRVNLSPTHQYMMHLVPQQPTMVSPVTTFNPSAHVVRSASSSLVNKFRN